MICDPIASVCVRGFDAGPPLDPGPPDIGHQPDSTPTDAGFADARAPDAGVIERDAGPRVLELRSAPLHAIIVSDDDGARAANITAQQLAGWVDDVNQAFEPARIRLTLDARTGVSTVASSLLNQLSKSGGSWPQQKRAADAMVVAGGITVFFRHGASATASAGGFSGSDVDFMVMPGYDAARRCGAVSAAQFAFVLGQQLGLRATGTGVFTSTAAAAAHLAGRSPAVFDGDGLPDTAPDPNVAPEHCTAVATTTIGPHVFELPRDNVMSLYQRDRATITPMQAAMARQAFLLLTGGDVRPMIAGTALSVIEAEGLSSSATAGRVFTQLVIPQGVRWSGAAQLLWLATAVGDRLELSFAVPRTGNYALHIMATMSWDYGIYQHAIDGVMLGGPTDLYSRQVNLLGPLHLGTVRLEAGWHTLGARVTGSSVASRHYYGLDYLLLEPR